MSFTPPSTAPKRRSLRSRSGFTIVEVAVAAAVMALVIASSILVLQSGFKALDTARKTTLAAQIMQSEMEHIRMLNWSRVQTLMAGSTQIDLSLIFPQNTVIERKILTQMQETFTATRTMAYVTGFSNEVVEITVAITWKGLDGTTHNRSSSTRYCKNGLYAYYYTVVAS